MARIMRHGREQYTVLNKLPEDSITRMVEHRIAVDEARQVELIYI